MTQGNKYDFEFDKSQCLSPKSIQDNSAIPMQSGQEIGTWCKGKL
jgi:hypothetical protein